MKPKVLLATPAYSGLVTHHFYLSMMKLIAVLHEQQIPYGFIVMSNGGLISCSRNSCAQEAIASGYDKLFFIDADIGFEPEQFLSIYNSNKQVVGGTYRLKQEELVLAYNALPEDGTDTRSFHGLKNLKRVRGNEVGEFQVRHLPTGFMCIDTTVLWSLKALVETYLDFDKQHWDFFPTKVVDRQYETEDWAFCSLVRKHLTCGVWLNANVICTHTGTTTFKV